MASRSGEMFVRVASLRSGENVLTFETPIHELNMPPFQECGLRLSLPVRSELVLIRNGCQVLLDGTIRCQATMSCASCGNEFARVLEEQISVDFRPITPSGSLPRFQELLEGELDRVFYDGEGIDLLPHVRDTLLLAVPFAPLCHPECKGICAFCGANMNLERCACVTPRVSGIAMKV
ncbi:MAG: DUF177 domain-containing protein [candidate division WOR-3 bacterium]